MPYMTIIKQAKVPFRHENRKIRHENELLKAKEPTPDV
jgi:hypothetical protein